MMMGGGILTIFVFFGFFLLLTAGVIFGVYWIYQQRSQDKPVANKPESPDENPLQILQRCYANGEISREEYTKMKEDLTR